MTVASDDSQVVRALAIQVAAQLTIRCAAELLASDLARVLGAPVALLSRDQLGWRFEAQAFPRAPARRPSGISNGVEPPRKPSTSSKEIQATRGPRLRSSESQTASGHCCSRAIPQCGVSGLASTRSSKRSGGAFPKWRQESGKIPPVGCSGGCTPSTGGSRASTTPGGLNRARPSNHRVAGECPHGFARGLRRSRRCPGDRRDARLPIVDVEHLRIQPGEGLIGGVTNRESP